MADIKYITLLTGDVPQKAYNDISFDISNDVILVYGKEYAQQAVAKALLSKQNNINFFSTYGTELDALKFYDMNDPIVQRAVVDTVTGAIIYQDTIETSNIPAERVKSIDDVQLVQETTTASHGIRLRVYLTLKSNEKLNLNVGG